MREDFHHFSPRHRFWTSSSLSLDLADKTTLAPSWAAFTAVAAPIPLDAPVIQITFPRRFAMR